jgi:hypothetical protein
MAFLGTQLFCPVIWLKQHFWLSLHLKVTVVPWMVFALQRLCVYLLPAIAECDAEAASARTAVNASNRNMGRLEELELV